MVVQTTIVAFLNPLFEYEIVTHNNTMVFKTTLLIEVREQVRGLANYSPVILTLVFRTYILAAIIAVATVLLGIEVSLTFQTELSAIIVGNIVAITVLYYVLDQRSLDAVFLFKRPSVKSVIGVCVAVIGIIVITVLLKTPSFQAETTPSSLEGAPLGFQLQMFLFVVLVFPLIEEIFFRGLLFGYVLDYSGSLLVAFLSTILLFGLVHAEYGLIGVLTRTIASSVYVVQRVKYNSITESYLTHGTYNAIVFFGLIGLL